MKIPFQVGRERSGHGVPSAGSGQALRFRMTTIARIVFGALGLLWCNVASAATYYVSNTGLDSNNGTSPATAWQTE